MNGVIGMADLLLETTLDEEQETFSSTIKSSAEALLVIINDVLDYSKIEAEKLELNPAAFDLRRAVEEVLLLLQPAANDKDVGLYLDYDLRLPTPIIGDPGRIRQVLTNLIGNAVKFTARGSVDLRMEAAVDDGADGEATIAPNPLPTCPSPPAVTIRDFSRSDPDFQPLQDAYAALEDGDPVKERARGDLRGVLAPDLELRDGAWKPVLAWPEGALPYTTAESFARWWTDGPGRNTPTPNAGTFRRTRQDTFGFFASNGPRYAATPLVDGDFGFGAEELSFNLEGVPTPMNTALTVEVAGEFVHEAGRRLRYGATADLWVFVNHRLAWESGGFLNKGFQRGVLELDALGLTVGERYDLHVFAGVNRGSRGNPHLWIEHPACL